MQEAGCNHVCKQTWHCGEDSWVWADCHPRHEPESRSQSAWDPFPVDEDAGYSSNSANDSMNSDAGSMIVVLDLTSVPSLPGNLRRIRSPLSVASG